jgi:hypothetical protein
LESSPRVLFRFRVDKQDLIVVKIWPMLIILPTHDPFLSPYPRPTCEIACSERRSRPLTLCAT